MARETLMETALETLLYALAILAASAAIAIQRKDPAYDHPAYDPDCRCHSCAHVRQRGSVKKGT